MDIEKIVEKIDDDNIIIKMTEFIENLSNYNKDERIIFLKKISEIMEVRNGNRKYE